MKLTQTAIPDVVLIEPTVYEDERGWFMESYNEQRFHTELQKLGLPVPRAFVQDNHSYSKKGVLRGLHYQRHPFAQGKLIRIIKGKVWDVAVDIRPKSATYGCWVAEVLSEENRHMLWIPEGFAHGFYCLSEDAEVVYKCTDYYSPDTESCLAWNDQNVKIDWPISESLIV